MFLTLINININIKINTLRDQLNVFTTNNSRKVSVLSNASSISYIKRIQALKNSPIWTKQVKNNKS